MKHCPFGLADHLDFAASAIMVQKWLMYLKDICQSPVHLVSEEIMKSTRTLNPQCQARKLPTICPWDLDYDNLLCIFTPFCGY